MPEPTGPENKILNDLMSSLGGCVEATSITNTDRLKVAICGEPKTGKSGVIARTARKPALIYDFDDRRESIAGQEGVIIKTLFDKDDTTPIAWAKLETDVKLLEYQKEKGPLPIKSIALDSMTYLRKYAEHQLLKDSGSVTRTKMTVGTTVYNIPKDWDAVTGVQHMLETMLNRLFSLDIDVYVTFHTRLEKDQIKSTTQNTVYKDSLTVEPPNLKMLLAKFNEQWRTYIDGGVFRLQLKPSWEFTAATALKNMEASEEANIQKMLEKHNGKK